ncbi:MAG: hypothetical protein ABSC03_00455 [Verrucomicrobiota bacterium]
MFSYQHRRLPAASLAAVVALLAWTGCDRSEVRSYRAAKNAGDAPVMAPEDAAGPGTPHWRLPAGWQELPPGSMRVGSFAIAGDAGERAEVSIIPLAGTGGGDFENANRWRGQVGLPPLDHEPMDKIAEAVAIAGSPARLFDFVGTSPGAGKPTRLLAAILHRGDTAWFFKMTGDDKLVAAQKPAFVAFLKDIVFAAAAAPAAPAVAGPVPAVPGPVMSPATSAARPSWTVPAGWQETTPGPMQLAKFLAAGADGPAEITVVTLPGTGGGPLPNVNRWRGQIGLPPVTEAELAKLLTPLPGADAGSFLVDVANPEKENRLVAAFVGRGGGTWFYKLTGGEAAVGRAKEAFVQFVQSVKYAP